MRHEINKVCEKFSLQLRQVYKKIHSIFQEINANIDKLCSFYDLLISCNDKFISGRQWKQPQHLDGLGYSEQATQNININNRI